MGTGTDGVIAGWREGTPLRPDARFQQRTSIFLTASFHLRKEKYFLNFRHNCLFSSVSALLYRAP
jgi:hypothetical protein